MSADLKIIKGANIFSDENPDESFHLQLDEVAIPDLTKVYETHSPGGGFMQLDISMEMLEALVLPFKLVGIAASMLSKIGLNDGQPHTYNIFKDVHDMRTREQIRLMATVRGEMGSVKQDAYNKKGLSGFNYEVKAIESYRLDFGNQTIYDFDFFANRFLVRGADQFAKTNANLGIV
jgi:P2 family phage contractile tail tube protein